MPENIEQMESAFEGCKKLTGVPIWLSGAIRNAKYAFARCESLKLAPNFMDGTYPKNLSYAFLECKNLKLPPQLPTKSTCILIGTFKHCESLSCAPILPKICATAEQMLMGTAIEKAPLIHEDIVKVNEIFNDCKKLHGVIQIDAKIENIMDAMSICKGVNNPIIIAGNCPIVKEIAECSEGLDVSFC